MIITYAMPSQAPESFETDSNSIIFGRNPSTDQHVDIDLVADDYVSHQHTRLTYENEEYWVEDLGSTNGTWLNKKKISVKTRLQPGDKIKVGHTIVEVQMESAAAEWDPDTAPDSATLIQEPENPEALMSELAHASELPAFAGKPAEPEDPEALLSELAQASELPAFAEEPAEPKASIRDIDPTPKLADTVTRNKESIPTVSEPEPIPLSEGTIIDFTNVTTHPFAVSGKGSADEMLTQSWQQLTAFNDLCQMLSGAETLDSLVQILVENLRKAIPNAQRGAVLLPDERGELLLKAHWPPGDHSVSMTWIKRAYHRREPFIWSAPPESSPEGDTPQSALYYSVQSAIYVPLWLGDQVLGVMYVDNHYTREAFFATDLELMRAIANHVAMFVRDHVLRQDLQREEKLTAHMSRQFSPKIAQRIFGKDSRLRIGGEWADPVTILVSDVRSFTALSAKMEPEDVVRMLNEMFDAFVPIIFDYDGVVDKYVGDSVLAVFGSPEKDDRQCEKAVQAALEMQQAVYKLGEGRKVRRLPVFEVGISVHTGAVIHGFIGSSERMEYTVIGDTVNRASRYCDGAAAGEVVISKTAYERVYQLVNVEPKIIRTKHPDIEPDLEAFIVKGLKKDGPRPLS